MAPPAPTLPPAITHLSSLYYDYVDPILPAPIQSVVANTTPLLTNLLTSASNGDFSSILAALVVLYLSVRIADYIRRSVIAWVLLFVKIGLLLGLVNAVLYVNQVGLDKALADAQWVAELVWGFVGDKVAAAAGGGGGENTTKGFNLGGRQQVPVGKTGSRRSAGGWY